MRGRGFCFVMNNYGSDDYKKIQVKLQEAKAVYYIIGKEKGEVNHTPHLQGYVYFANPREMSAMIKRLPGCHIEIAKGSAEQNKIYCSKEGKFIEFGKIPEQGRRSDLEAVAAAILSGDYDETRIAEEFPVEYIKYARGIKTMMETQVENRKEPPTVVWLWGLSGVGKTYYAHDKHGVDNVFIKDEAKWWGSYNHELAILIDDFDPEEWNYRRFLRLLDGYAYEGETKGGHVKINSSFIYISCEYPPEHFWSENKLDQVESRLSEIIEIKGQNRRKKPIRKVIDNRPIDPV